MSLIQVKSVIENFVQNKRNDLLIIKGNWGVGKTYFWQSTIAEASRKGKIGHTNYSYISLFGIDSFESLKNTITANQIKSTAIGKDINTSASVLISKGKNIAKHLEKSNYIRNFSGGLGSEFFFQFVKDAVICFDDLERKSDKFDIKEILGLASFLKEQKNCKIVFILNDGTLSDSDRESFVRHNEKVVDIELNFNPLPEEVFEYIFDESHPYFELIKYSCLVLEIKNIRILQRIKRFIEDLLPQLKNIEQIVSDQVISSIILFVWSYYDKDSETINFDFLKYFSSLNIYLKKEIWNEKVSEEDEIKYELLMKYNYSETDEVDKQLMKFVRKGFLDNEFFEALKVKNEQTIARKGKDSYSEVWKLYRTDFDLDENVFTDKLVSAFRTNEKYLSYTDLYEVISQLRRYGKNQLANDLIDEFLPKKIDYEKLEELRLHPHFKNYEDEYFLKKLNEIKKTSENYTFAEVMNVLIENKYLYGDMLSFLALTEVDEYYNYLKFNEKHEFYYLSKLLLNYGNNSSEQHQAILDKTKKALLKIASESKINRNRISDWFNINIDEWK